MPPGAKRERAKYEIDYTHHKHCRGLYPRDRASKEDFLPCGSSYMVRGQGSEYWSLSSLTAQASCFPLGLGRITSVILLPHDYE